MPSQVDTRIIEMISDAYTEHSRALLRHCRFRMMSTEDAEEVVHDTFMNACKYLARGNKIENLKVFLYRVANNLIVDQVRKNKANKQLSLDALLEKGFDPSSDNLPSLKNKIEVSRILKSSKELNKDDYKLLVMRYIDGLMPADIENITGVSKNTISVRLHRAVKLLAKEVKE